MIRIAKSENRIIRYDVAIATRDSRLRFQILELLNRLKLKYVICSPDDSDCEFAKVIITTEKEAMKFADIRLIVVKENTNDDFIIPLMIKLHDIHKPTNAVLGIDPGMRFGLALVIDGFTIYTKRANSPSYAAKITIKWMQYIQDDFPQCQLLIRIGTGSRLYSILYLREILRINNGLSIELVNEQNTTRMGKSDQLSAILIAGRWGQSLGSNPDLSLESKGGYIKSLKRLISKLTEGKRLLSTEEARSIIKDEISLDDFLPTETS